MAPIGAAVLLPHMEILRDWLFDTQRPIEIQDFVVPNMGDPADLITRWRAMLDGHTGPRGIHGPFFGIDLSNPDREIRAVLTRRLVQGVEIAARLEADLMVIHSPFTFWHRLNYVNYGQLRAGMMEACADCLAPVLERASAAGVTLALENIDDTDPADRADLVAMINHPRLALSVDTGHADLAHGNYGAPPVVDVLTLAGARLVHVHLQDVDGHADRHWHPGDGRIPWQPVIDTLATLPGNPRLLLEVRNNLHRLPETAAWLEGLGGERKCGAKMAHSSCL